MSSCSKSSGILGRYGNVRELLVPLAFLLALESVPGLMGVLMSDRTVARRLVDIGSCFGETFWCAEN